MARAAIIAIDVVAITVLAFALYFPRYGRRDIVVAFVALNVGVVATSVALTSVTVGVGFGIGLFGVLSMIRLRSTEIDQQEVAYYFGSLTLGLLAGMAPDPQWLSPALSAGVVAAIFVGDHPRLLRGHRRQVVTIDRAVTDEHALREALEDLLHADVRHMVLRRLDLVNDTTTVDVRYRVLAPHLPRLALHDDRIPDGIEG